MRFFCTQPDVVEDAQEMHYRTKSSALANRSNGGHNEHTGHHGHQGHHLATNMEEGIDGLNRSRSSLSLFKGKKIFKRRGTIANPGPGIGNDSDLTSGSDAAPKKERRKSHRMSAPLNGLANATGISSLLPGQGQGHEQEDHNSGGKGNGNGYISGTDKDPKKKKRISKQTIGAPEGFRHEAHFGLGATFTKASVAHLAPCNSPSTWGCWSLALLLFFSFFFWPDMLIVKYPFLFSNRMVVDLMDGTSKPGERKSKGLSRFVDVLQLFCRLFVFAVLSID